MARFHLSVALRAPRPQDSSPVLPTPLEAPAGVCGVPGHSAQIACGIGLGCACYFEYVRSEANVSDEPSRTDLSQALRWDCGLGAARGMASTPVAVVLPEERDWAAAAGEWSLRAQRA